MNTISIPDGENGAMITYTDNEVARMVADLKYCKERSGLLGEANTSLSKDIGKLRNLVRDFFSEVEWVAGEQTVSKTDVNELLESIGALRLTTTYGGSFTITGTFQVEAEDEDEAASMFTEHVDVNFYEGDITIDDTTTDDVSEDY